MPIYNGMGQSEHTQLKHAQLAGIIDMHLRICQGIASRYDVQKWWYLDLNAGDGSGSPAFTWDIVQRYTLPFSVQGVMIDNNPRTAQLLANRFQDETNVSCYCSDNHEFARSLIRNIDTRCDYGVVFHDPNGGEINLPMLRLFEKTRLDLVVYYSGAGNKRLYHAFKGKRGVLLGSVVKAIDVKKHWLIRSPAGRHQWTLLIGSNWTDWPKWKSQGFFDLHSPEGEAIFERLHHTRGELQERDQMPLDFPEPPYRTYREYLRHPKFREVRSQVMQRAGGICEVCHQARATEVHHLRYPKWGTFDVPENLVAICHPCHCKAHGKEA